MMPRRRTLASFLLLLLFAPICAAQERIKDEGTPSWSCPPNWKAFTNGEPYECLWASLTSATSYANADAFCKAMDSYLVTIQSEEKWMFVRNMIETADWDTMWMALRKDSRNYDPVTWRTRFGVKQVSFRPRGFEPQKIYSSGMCVIMDSDGNWYQRSCDSNYRLFVCEKQIECHSGRFGGRCEKECHCHSEPCNSNPLDVTCRFGCLPGWMGPACDVPREKASVEYHCIHSGNSDRRVSIEIDTKGIPYRHIQGIDNADTAYPWCNDTNVHMSRPDEFVNINIPVTDAAMEDMKEGRCAGQQITGDLYEWRIALQEWEGIFMPDDQVVLIRCNFSDAETLLRSGGAKVNGQMTSAASESKETKEEVVLEVADAATRKKVLSTFVGAPVILKVQFNLSKGSLVKSIFPYDCEAMTADGAQRLRLLDYNGCQVEGSPVQPFMRTNDKDTIVTPWFPYFTFHGYSEIFFQCSFVFCYDTSCGMGCGDRYGWETDGRYVASTNDNF